MRALVTGATGVIGGNVATHLPQSDVTAAMRADVDWYRNAADARGILAA